MIQPIMKDIFLQQKFEPATQLDAGRSGLQDTLAQPMLTLVGHGQHDWRQKRIIIVNMGFTNLIMYNPVLIKGQALSDRGRLSVAGRYPPDDTLSGD